MIITKQNFKYLLPLAEGSSHAYFAYHSSGSQRVFCIARTSISAIKIAEAASGSAGELSQTCSAVVDFADDVHTYATQPRTRLQMLTLVTSALAAGTAIVVIVRSDNSEGQQSKMRATALFTIASSAASVFRAFAAR